MRWSADPNLPSLVAQLVGRRQDTLGTQLSDKRSAVVADLTHRGLSGSGSFITKITEVYTESFQEYARGLTQDFLELVQAPDGALESEAAAWVREQLEPNFEATAQRIVQAISDGARTQGLTANVTEAINSAVFGIKRDLTIMLGKASLRRTDSAKTVDQALLDVLVPLKNRRAFDGDLPELLDAARTSGDPLALVVFDIDHFKRVNDDHGGHATGDEALIAVAQLVQSCVKGKGTAYRTGGDEFALVLPNHTVQEAIAVAERLRVAINGTSLTSRSLTLSVSVGIAVFPEHGSDVDALKQAADNAQYDAKQLGRNLVRVSGEPAPAAPGPRDPERREPTPGGLTDEQKRKIRQQYFRDRVARCPHDEAMLDVKDMTSFGQQTRSIYISCPLCGLSEELD